MTVNLGSIPTQVIIQNPTPLDVSQAFVSLTISGNALDESGWYRPRGQVVLGVLPGFSESFDCRVNPGRWAPGNEVSVSVWLDGGWVPLPWRLRILAYPNRPMPGNQRISLEVGTDADLLNYRAPEGDPGTDEYGTPTEASTLINRALAQAGAPALVTGSVVDTLRLPFSPEKNTGGSWITYAGSVAFAARHILWQRGDGAIVPTPVTLDGLTPVTAYTVGTNEADYILEAPGEQPPEVVEVQGTTYLVESAEPEDTDVTENINGIITRTRVEYKDWFTNEPKIIETVWIPLELINVGFFAGNRMMSLYKRTTATKTYDQWGRLIGEYRRLEQPEFAVPLTPANKRTAPANNVDIIIVTDETITYEFPVVQSSDPDLLQRLKTEQVVLRKITSRRSLFEKIVGGVTVIPLSLRETFSSIESWEKKSPELYLQRIETRDGSDPAARNPLNPSPVMSEPQFVPPPQTQFKPAEKQRTEKAAKGSAKFTNAVGSSYAEKKWVISLPSGMGVSGDQCRAHAALWGKIRQGRQFQIKWSGDLTADWLTNFSPIRRVDFTLNGVTTAYLVEAFNIAIDQRSAAVGGLGLELGQVDGANLVPPYVMVPDVLANGAIQISGGAVVSVPIAMTVGGVVQLSGGAVIEGVLSATAGAVVQIRGGASLNAVPAVRAGGVVQLRGGAAVSPVIGVSAGATVQLSGGALVADAATPWTPAQLSTALWLDAADSATLFDATSGGGLVGADGAIARWEDKSGNARHATQATSGNRPLRRVSFVNGWDVADFNRASLHRMAHPVPVADPDNLTVAVMFRGTTGTAAEFLWCHRSETTRLLYLSWESGILYWAMRGSGNSLQFLSQSLALNQWHFAIATLNVPGNSHQLRVNGTLIGTNTYNFGTETFNSTINLIGDQSLGGAPVGNVFGGQMSQLLLMNSTISTTDAEKLEGYWAHRYGLTANLPSGHPYKTVAP